MIDRTCQHYLLPAALAITVAALGAVCGSSNVHAQTPVDAVIGEQLKVEEAAQASQARVEQLDRETSGMLAEYRQTIAETQSLRAYNEQLAAQVASQTTELDTMTRQLGEIETTSREVLPMMQRMLATLEQFVALDVPFLPEERSGRIAQLKEMMGRADVSISEKYRRIVEAYQIETEYGRTLEAYQGKVDGKTVDFLRAGRVSLMYQTLDGRETGYWNASTGNWETDDKFTHAVAEALRIAKKQIAPDFITVALPAPKETT